MNFIQIPPVFRRRNLLASIIFKRLAKNPVMERYHLTARGASLSYVSAREG